MTGGWVGALVPKANSQQQFTLSADDLDEGLVAFLRCGTGAPRRSVSSSSCCTWSCRSVRVFEELPFPDAQADGWFDFRGHVLLLAGDGTPALVPRPASLWSMLEPCRR
jgi:hypothetical protein